MVIAEEEMKNVRIRRDLLHLFTGEAVFGGIVALVGLIGIINELTNFLGKLTLLELVIFLGSFCGFRTV